MVTIMVCVTLLRSRVVLARDRASTRAADVSGLCVSLFIAWQLGRSWKPFTEQLPAASGKAGCPGGLLPGPQRSLRVALTHNLCPYIPKLMMPTAPCPPARSLTCPLL